MCAVTFLCLDNFLFKTHLITTSGVTAITEQKEYHNGAPGEYFNVAASTAKPEDVIKPNKATQLHLVVLNDCEPNCYCFRTFLNSCESKKRRTKVN